MYKKIIFSLIGIFMLPMFVSASITPMAKIGNKYYDSLEEAILNASSADTIMLVSDVVLEDTLTINKEVNINLNGNDITAPEKVFMIKGGFLDISGNGTIKETSPNYGAIMLVGSSEVTNDKYSSVHVGKDVTLEGWSGIFINHENSKSYGVNVYLDGKINAVNDVNGGTGIGIYVNGNIKDEEAHPVVSISDDALIKSTGNGLYIAGYSTFYIGDAYIEGVESGIGIKSGKLIINGATVIGNGEDKTPTEGYNNGIKASGTAIQIESNNGYKGKIEIDISRGNFISENSNVLYEYIGRGNQSLIYSMSISGGNFVSNNGKEVFSFSDSFKDIHSGFISGGEYSSNPTEYLKSGYTTTKEDSKYNVIKSTVKLVNSNSSKSNEPTFLKSLISLIAIVALGILTYINRVRISNWLNKILNNFKK
ncbi:MAG: hypothetical protein E7174_00635 [Firmicutes bacterium]|nr:hypothetical protein [Bacillota bacterium]